MIAYKQRVIDMDKLTMAHQMALAMQSSEPITDVRLLSSLCFQYADAMQAEADKREPSGIPDVLRGANGEIVAVKVCEEQWQPDWSQAPDDVTAWEYLGYGNARWHTTTKGFYKEAPSFDRPYYGAMVLHKRP